jgi:hypothetical protein
MEPNICIAFKQSGERCSIAVHVTGTRCGVHRNTLNQHGPNSVRRKELGYVHRKNMNDIRANYFTALRNVEEVVTQAVQDELRHAYKQAKLTEQIRNTDSTRELNTIIYEETVQNGGIDADIMYRQAHRDRVTLIAQQQRERNRIAHIEYRERAVRMHQFHNNLIEGIYQPFPHRGELAILANDRQNIHTTLVLEKVKKIVEEVLKIDVPAEYQTETLKTSGEIILECKLSRKAVGQMMAKYCSDDDIYDLGEGIYSRVLNSVWQYIKASPDAEDLKKILATEMEDNIGMCAQGNLTRICNILSGYIDIIDIDVQSRNEKLGERLSALLDIEDLQQRRTSAQVIFEDMNIPREDWQEWLTPLIEV